VQEVKKGTYQPNKRRMKKKHGFFSRMKSGIINNRRRKGRKKLSK
jgi:ribosomal protein L34